MAAAQEHGAEGELQLIQHPCLHQGGSQLGATQHRNAMEALACKKLQGGAPSLEGEDAVETSGHVWSQARCGGSQQQPAFEGLAEEGKIG